MTLHLWLLFYLNFQLNLFYVDGLFGIPEFVSFGTCEQPHLEENFDVTKYQGLWFDILRIPNEYLSTQKCVSQNQTWSGSLMRVPSKGMTLENVKKLKNAVMTPSVNTAPIDPAHMIAISNSVPNTPYKILSTDYVQYSCIYACLQYTGFKAEFAWVLSRRPELSKQFVNICKTKFENINIDFSELQSILQGPECPYYDKLKDILSKNHLFLKDILSEDEYLVLTAENNGPSFNK